MKLQEILDKIYRVEPLTYEELQPRLKQIRAYFLGYHLQEPILVTWNITNTGGIHTIATQDDFLDTINEVIEKFYPELDTEETINQIELIQYYSQFIKNLTN